jgi:hypothetical protein
MPYSVENYRGTTTVAVVEDGTVNNTLDIKLIGKDYPNYGEVQNENFVFLLENFADGDAPDRPINGQLWYDSTNRKIRVYDAVGLKWRAVGGADVSSTAPTGVSQGDLWYDSVNKKLYINESTGNFILVGPQSVTGKGQTQLYSDKVTDTLSVQHAIIKGFVDGELVYIISNDSTFTISSNDLPNYNGRFTTIKPGLNLVYTNDNGITSLTNPSGKPYRYWGTSTDSDRLGGLLPSAFLTALNPAFLDSGFTVGDDNDLHVYVDSGDQPTIENQLGNSITFKTKDGSASYTPLKIVGNTLVPGVDSSTNIGSDVLKFNTIYANTFNGVSTKSDTVNVGGSYRTASITATSNTIAARDNLGNITANVFNGVATSARYADLAEKYLADDDYDIGTVMIVGGEKEITLSSAGERAIGVVSENPAYMMNCDLENGTYVALKGRVPVKVFGKVSKGDRLIAWNHGTAIAVSSPSSDIFAIALESTNDSEITLIEAIIL